MPGSLPRHGENAWLRRPYRLGRGDDMTAARLVCGACGTEVSANAKFCSQCGAPITTATTPAENKQITVLFADVVRSMYVAAAVAAPPVHHLMAQPATPPT